MKILHVLYSGLGGHGNVFFSLVHADKSGEFIHEALFVGVEEMREEYKERCTKENISFTYIKKQPGFDLTFYKKIIKAIKSAEPAVIFLHGSSQVVWAKIAIAFKKPSCHIIVRETQANHLKTKQDWFWLTAALVLAKKIVFLTPEYHIEIKKKLSWFYSKKKVAVIANGLDLDEYKPKYKASENMVVIGMQSRIVKIKDHITLLHAFANLLKNTTLKGEKLFLKIAGDGDCRVGLEQLSKTLGIDQQVEFTGMLTEQQLIEFLSGLDIYVHASFGETMSTAIMQAMACGKPIVASDVAGINNMIQDNINGLLSPLKDEIKLASILELLINDSSLQEKLGTNALSYARHNFSNQVMFENYRKAFLE